MESHWLCTSSFASVSVAWRNKIERDSIISFTATILFWFRQKCEIRKSTRFWRSTLQLSNWSTSNSARQATLFTCVWNLVLSTLKGFILMRQQWPRYYFRVRPCCEKIQKIQLHILLRLYSGWTSDEWFLVFALGVMGYLTYCITAVYIVMATATHFSHDEFGSKSRIPIAKINFQILRDKSVSDVR